MFDKLKVEHLWDEHELSRRGLLLGAGAATAAAVLPAFSAPASAQTEAEPVRALIEVRPGIYRTQDGRHFGLLIDTADGVIVFDTMSRAFSEWLDGEIKRRFDKPVRYVVYSHNHADHVSGGQAFAHHQPVYLSHSLARESMARMKVDTLLPNHTFDQGFTIELGGKRVDLRYHGPNDGRGSISLLVPEQRVLSVIDWVVIGRMPFRDLARYDVEGMIRSLHEVEAMDFEIAAPGHADTGGKDGVRLQRRYLEAVRDGVVEGIAAREPLDAIIPKVRAQVAAVPEFRSLAMFDDWVDLNIAGVHHQIARIEGFQDG